MNFRSDAPRSARTIRIGNSAPLRGAWLDRERPLTSGPRSAQLGCARRALAPRNLRVPTNSQPATRLGIREIQIIILPSPCRKPCTEA